MEWVKTGNFTEDFKFVQVPNGKVWEVYGIRAEVHPALIGERTISLGASSEQGEVLFESISSPLPVTEITSSPVVVCGVSGMSTGILSTTFFNESHGAVQLPDRLILPSGFRIFGRFKSDPSSASEIKRLFILADESIDSGA